MKTFKEFVTEVQAPLSQGEKNFFNAHNPINHKDLVPGVTDQEHVFNGSPQRKDPRTASYENDQAEKAYDKNLKVEESLEEKHLTPNEMKKREEIVKSLKKKGMEKGKAYAIATATAKRVAEATELGDDDGWYTHREIHGDKGISREDWKKGWRLNLKGERVQTKTKSNEEVEVIDESDFEKNLTKKQRARLNAAVFKASPQNPVNIEMKKREAEKEKTQFYNSFKRPSTNEDVEVIDERNKENKFKKDLHVASMGKRSIDKFDLDHDKMAKDFGHTRDQIRDTMKSRLKTFKRVGRQMTREESEQLDELGRGTLMNYGSKAMDAAREARKKGDRETASKRTAGMDRAASKLFPAMYKNTDKKSYVHASEEVEIDEAAMPKFHHEGPKGATHVKKDSETGEHVVRFWKKTDSGYKRHEAGDYFTDDKEDAHNTAKKMVGEEVVNELDDKRNSIINRYLSKTNPEHSSPQEIEKRKAGRSLALRKKWADEKFGDVDVPKVSARVREEVEELDEGMPSSVIKTKQRYAEMSDADFAKAHGNKSEKALQSMAWSHGYGKPGTPGHNHYVNRVKKGMSSEEFDLHEARPKTSETGKEESSEADQNIHTQLHKSLSIGKHVTFKNGDKKQVSAAHAQKALHMLSKAKPAERLSLQNSMSHSHDRFMKTVTHGRAVVDHPDMKKVSVAKSVKENADPVTKASDRGAMTAAVRMGVDGALKVIKRNPARDEIKIGEALDPVGKEDADIDNDGKKNTKSDKYLHNRRKTIKAAIRGAVKEAEEMTTATVASAASSQLAKGQSSTENMQQDSVNKIKKDPLASKEAVTLPPTQGNKPIGGESEPSRVGGKYSMEEEVLLNSLYSILSEENKALFEELMTTDEGIEQLLGFANNAFKEEQGTE